MLNLLYVMNNLSAIFIHMLGNELIKDWKTRTFLNSSFLLYYIYVYVGLTQVTKDSLCCVISKIS